MTRFIQLMCITLLLSPQALAQSEANETDSKVATTPSSVAELLPKDGADGLKYDFYMLVRSGNGGKDERGYCHRYTGRKVDGMIVVSELYENQYDVQRTTRWSYNATGELELFDDQFIDKDALFGGDNVTESRGKRYFDHIYVEVKQVDRKFTRKKTEEITTQYYTRRYRPSEITGDQCLMPLIFAYHFRQGHPCFSIKQHIVEQKGTEQVEFDGETRTVRELLVRNKSNGKAHCRLRVFDNGEYYSIELLGPSDLNYEGLFGYTQKRVTPAQLEEILDIKLDENGNPPAPWPVSALSAKASIK